MTVRRGYTLFELLVVLTILILLAIAVLPSVSGLRSGPRQRAAADVIRGELAVARARAMEEGRPYRVSLSQDGTRIRRAPDDSNFEQATAFNYPSGSSVVVDYPFDHVTAVRVADLNVEPPNANSGWITMATVQPDGACLEDTSLISLRENDVPGLYVRVRGLNGSSTVVPNSTVNGGVQ